MAPPGDVMPKALTAARRAVRLDPDLAEGWSALALVMLLWERDYEGSSAAFRRCLELNPAYIQGRCWYGLFQLQWVECRLAEGLAETERALQSDPLSAYATTLNAMTLFRIGRVSEAVQDARRAVELDPDSLLTRWVLGLTLHVQGAFDEAIDAYREAERVAAGHIYPIAWMVAAMSESGRVAEARAERARLIALAGRGYMSTALQSLAAAAVGESDAALDLAGQACDERDPLLTILQANGFPGYHTVRDDPRFAEIRSRLKLSTK